jgi:hypothetical protein
MIDFLPNDHGYCLPLLATGVVDTGGKFTTDIVHTDIKILTPVVHLE